ncbi:MAG: GrpB family protein [Proteobacteria bacterium]|nr:GrpB family protein [Pseudomonadota bacterium]
MSRILEIISYDPLWPKMFEEEAQKIKAALGENYSSLYHIGSTSVVSLAAKPIIDILLVVNKITDSYPEALASLDYKFRGRIVSPLSNFYQKGIPQPQFHLHLYEEGDEAIGLHLSLQHYLRNHPSEIISYSQLKFHLQEKYKDKNDYAQYRIEKAPFIEDLLQKAKFEGLTLNYIESSLNKNASEKDWIIFKEFQKEEFLNFKDDDTLFNACISEKDHLYFSLKKGLTVVTVAHVVMLDSHKAFLKSIATFDSLEGKKYAQKIFELLQKWANSHHYHWVQDTMFSKINSI